MRDPNCGTQWRNPIRGPKNDPNWDPNCGTHLRDPIGGDPNGDPKLGPKLGPKLRDPIEDPIGTQIVGPSCFRRFTANVLHTILGPTIWAPIWVPDWVPQFGSHVLLPIMWVLIWFHDQVSEYNSGQIAFKYPEIESFRTCPSPRGLARPAFVDLGGLSSPLLPQNTTGKGGGLRPPPFPVGFAVGRGCHQCTCHE